MAQKEHSKTENEAAHLANTVLEEKWNEAAKALLETGGKLWAARNLISRDPVSLMKLDTPEQGERFGSWTWRELADRSRQHSLIGLLATQPTPSPKQPEKGRLFRACHRSNHE